MSVPTASIAGVDKPVSRLVLGTMIINTSCQAESNVLMDSAIENGFTTLDCAHVYGGGGSERAIGVWMAERGNRDKVVVITKGSHPNGDRNRVTDFDIKADLHDSLTRLKSDYVDLYFLHRDDPTVPAGDVVEWLNALRDEGKIRAFGGSNWTCERLREANEYAAKHGLVPMAASSPHFSLAEQVDNPWGPGCVTLTGEAMAQARAWYKETDLAAFAYSSLARGLFSGRVTRGNYKETADGACQNAYCHEVNFQRLDRARTLGEEKGLSVAQVAVAYVMSYPLNLFGLVGAASADEIKANVEAVNVKLTPEEMAWLNLESDSR